MKSNHGRSVSEVANPILREASGVETTSHSPNSAVTELSTLRHAPESEPHNPTKSSLDASNDECIWVGYDNEKESMESPRSDLDNPKRYHLSGSSGVALTTVDSVCNVQQSSDDDMASIGPVESTEVDLSENQGELGNGPGVSFEGLVERLLSQSTSKADSTFTSIFLCLYRKFAAPSSLLLAIIRRFEELNEKVVSPLDRMTLQLRYLNLLKDWITDYPGDFAHPLSRRIMISFMQSLVGSQEYSTTTKEISPHLEILSEDDDTEWACSDTARSRANTTDSYLTMSSVQSVASTLNAISPTLTADSSTDDVFDNVNAGKPAMSLPNRISATPSSASSVSRSDNQSTGSFQAMPNAVEHAQRQAQLLAPVPRIPLTKFQWHQLMDLPEDEIAREITRIDWIMYSSIRPRDLIRHVSLQTEQREKCKSLNYVNRMIHHFNHIAFWATNMILLRDKPKHRAKALEKFMLIAWKLRYLNNYNSLGAVIAGINGTAVHRLSQTRDLITPESQKQFMRLEILMGTQKGHFAYRLAYGNTSTSRIPFLPLHRRDLVLAEEGNKTYIGGGDSGRINWKKFEIMGEVIIGIRKSQEVGYQNMPRSEEVQRLVLDGRFCKDDDVSFLWSLIHRSL